MRAARRAGVALAVRRRDRPRLAVSRFFYKMYFHVFPEFFYVVIISSRPLWCSAAISGFFNKACSTLCRVLLYWS